MSVPLLGVVAADRRPALLDSGRHGAAYLARHIRTEGRFRYLLDPVTGRGLKGYNLLRHAGALLALARWAPLGNAPRISGPEMTGAIARATEYLLRKLCHPPGGAFRCLASKGRAKLGGAGLLTLALLEAGRLPGQRSRLPLCEELADYLASQQNADGGFQSILVLDGSGASTFNSGYYPGQAVLALAEVHAAGGGARHLEAALKGADWLLRAETLPLPRIDHADHWTIMALEALHRRHPDPAYAARVLDGAARIRELLIGTGPDGQPRFRFPDYGCGPAATRGEALAAAGRLARRTGMHAEADATHRALAAIVAHCLEHQWHPGAASQGGIAVHAAALGGFRRASNDPNIRIDTVQHAILAVHGLLEADGDGTP
ncbi:MAG TPA: hypothetical protein VEX87_12550 [Skermanella sp.]|nr:hypothetical protein [Skermanella sp.]